MASIAAGLQALNQLKALNSGLAPAVQAIQQVGQYQQTQQMIAANAQAQAEAQAAAQKAAYDQQNAIVQAQIQAQYAAQEAAAQREAQQRAETNAQLIAAYEAQRAAVEQANAQQQAAWQERYDAYQASVAAYNKWVEDTKAAQEFNTQRQTDLDAGKYNINPYLAMISNAGDYTLEEQASIREQLDAGNKRPIIRAPEERAITDAPTLLSDPGYAPTPMMLPTAPALLGGATYSQSAAPSFAMPEYNPTPVAQYTPTAQIDTSNLQKMLDTFKGSLQNAPSTTTAPAATTPAKTKNVQDPTYTAVQTLPGTSSPQKKSAA